jgi:predicted SAM-dependent methyltransferase
MPFEDIFSCEITESEKRNGFILCTVPNFSTLDHFYLDRPKTIKVVIYPIPPSHRIVKQPVLNQFVYTIWMFGKLAETGDPEWYQCDSGYFGTPDEAVSKAKSYISENQPADFIALPAPSEHFGKGH